MDYKKRPQSKNPESNFIINTICDTVCDTVCHTVCDAIKKGNREIINVLTEILKVLKKEDSKSVSNAGDSISSKEYKKFKNNPFTPTYQKKSSSQESINKEKKKKIKQKVSKSIRSFHGLKKEETKIITHDKKKLNLDFIFDNTKKNFKKSYHKK